MKYTVLGFQQEKLIKNSLTIEDALLLRTIKDMYSSDRMDSIIKDEKRYIWINQAYLLEQIPILGSMSKLKRMLNKLCNDELLENVLITNKKGIAGRFYYVKHTSKLDSLEDYETKVQNDTRPNVKMTLNQSSKWHNKDSSIKDSSIKDNKDNNTSTIVEEIWSLYPNKKGRADSIKKIPILYKKYGEELKKAVERYASECKGKEKQFIQHGSTFFNGGYVDYLDKNFININPKGIQTVKSSFDFGGM